MFCFKKFLVISFSVCFFFSTFSSFAADSTDPNEMGLIIISDPHIDVKLRKSSPINPAPDVSQELDQESFKSLIAKIGNYIDTHPEHSQAVILLGDLSAHNSFHQKTTHEDMSLVFEQLFEKLNPISIFYVFGNNDSPQRDYGPFSVDDDSAYQLFSSITGSGNGFISTGLKCPFNGAACVNNENSDKGYYSAYLGDHLKLISLNSVLFVSRPDFSPSRDGDKAELKWLQDELKSSKEKHENVILSMHVPPQQWEAEYIKSFKDIIKTYPDVVIGMLAAHTHFDEIHAITVQNQQKTYVIPVVYSAGLGTDHGNASSFKTMILKRNTSSSPWVMNDYATYNFIGNQASTSTLNQYYDFMQSFCPQKGTNVAECLHSHIHNNKFDAEASTLMSKHYTAGNPHNTKTVDAAYKWLDNYR